MIPKWIQWPALFLFAAASLRFGIPPEVTAAYRLTADPTWAMRIDYFQKTWPAWVGAAISLLWTMYLVAPPATSKGKSNKNHSRRTNAHVRDERR